MRGHPLPWAEDLHQERKEGRRVSRNYGPPRITKRARMSRPSKPGPRYDLSESTDQDDEELNDEWTPYVVTRPRRAHYTADEEVYTIDTDNEDL
jgi:hypothetical protein